MIKRVFKTYYTNKHPIFLYYQIKQTTLFSKPTAPNQLYNPCFNHQICKFLYVLKGISYIGFRLITILMVRFLAIAFSWSRVSTISNLIQTCLEMQYFIGLLSQIMFLSFLSQPIVLYHMFELFSNTRV